MSYAQDAKDELAGRVSKARHCRIAELAGMFAFGGSLLGTEDDRIVIFHSENEGVRNKYFTLLKKTINIHECDMEERVGMVGLRGQTAAEFLMVTKYEESPDHVISRRILQEMCCRRAYLRAAFTMAGSITDPKKGYHFEITCRTMSQAEQILSNMESFGLTPKIVERAGHPVVYLKESDEIADMLNVMEAPVTLLDFENVRVEKEMNNQVNRKVNCETANIGKMVEAAVREIRDIELIEKTRGLKSLPAKLEETARLRLEHPEMPLRELGELMDPPVGKSGVNHRLRRISAIADGIRD